MNEWWSANGWWVIALMKPIGVLALLAAAWFAGMWVRRAVAASLARAKFDTTLTLFFAQLARWAVMVVAALIALKLFGIEATSVAALIAALGLAVGLAFQGTLSNFAAGVMLLAFRPFKVGDVVEVAGELGTITEIELFFTQMDTFDNRRIILPNAQIFGSTIENLSYHPVRRADFNVGVAYDTDLDRAQQVIFDALSQVEGRDTEHEPQVMLLELADSSINWSARVWAPTAELWNVRARAIRDVKAALDEAGITIPFPQRDVHMVRHDASAVSVETE
ncbi:MAG: mechanosensitive ion channel family protein [Phycisphaeraceae bacterium]